jgi:hypothetical protein
MSLGVGTVGNRLCLNLPRLGGIERQYLPSELRDYLAREVLIGSGFWCWIILGRYWRRRGSQSKGIVRLLTHLDRMNIHLL